MENDDKWKPKIEKSGRVKGNLIIDEQRLKKKILLS